MKKMNCQVIIVPYRDRPQHLEEFLKYTQSRFIHIPIIIVEQENKKPFNRAKLLNVGALESPSLYYIMHDVDLLPIDCDYKPSANAEVVQFIGSKIQLKDYLGGVTMYTHNVLYKAGGYNNEYWHRAEDNEMMFNLKRLRIPVLEEHKQFTELPHKKSQHFIAALWDKAQKKRSIQNQLYCCEYKIISKEMVNENTTHLKVDI